MSITFTFQINHFVDWLHTPGYKLDPCTLKRCWVVEIILNTITSPQILPILFNVVLFHIFHGSP
ncbi:hypothetical protein HYC85_028536 [Camellia sinensis]|uniref:Uncharacterized protein n=1 Tax=Camellia sinensis TaxID=4442 RepID=A0A7J7FVI9_CAMSI|nr:hypothetical protein HYC85_028536 [Camellia sinensis]